MAKKTSYELALEIGGKIQSSLTKSVSGVNNKLDSIGKAAKTAAKIATAAFAAVKIGDFVKDAVDTYSEFNQAMAETAGIAGATEDEYKQLQAAAQEMGKRTTKTATEAAQALGYMSLAGWNVNDSISALEPVLRLSEATSMDLATCSDLVTDSMSALGLGVDDLTNYLNVAVQANNKSNTTAQALMEAMIGCGGAAKSAGMDYKQTAAALGILANNGIKGAEAGTALNSMLVRMTTKDVAQKAFKELGVSIYDSSGAMRNMQDILVELNGAMSGLSQEQKNNYMAAIAGTNYYTQFGYLLEGVAEGADGAASTWTQLTEAFENSDGALDAMADTMTDTLPGAMAIFGSAVDDAKIRLCEVFAPLAKNAIKGVADVIPSITDRAVGVAQSFYNTVVPAAENFAKKAITAFENIKAKIEENKPAIDKVIAVALNLKDKLFQAWDKAKPAISYIATVAIPAVIGAMMKAIGAAATVYQKLDEWGLLIPIITGIAGAVAAVKMIKFAKDTMNTVKAVKALVVVFGAEKKAMIANLALKAKDKLETAYIYALYAKDAVVKGISTAATWAQTAALTAWNAICAVGTAVTSALGAAFAFLTSPIGLVCVAIAAVIAIGVLLYKNWDTVKEKASQLGGWIVGVFNNLKEKASAAIQEFADKFPVAFAFLSSVFESWKQTITNIFSGVKQVFQGVVQFISGVFTGAWSSVKSATGSAWSAVKSATSSAWTAATGYISEKINGAKQVVSSVTSTIKSTASAAWSSVKSATSSAWTAVSSATNTAWTAASGYISNKINAAKATVSSVASSIRSTASAAWSAVSSATNSAWTTTTGYISNKINVAKATVSSVTSSIRSTASAAWSAVSSATSSAFENVRATMSNKINTAKANVSSALSGIRSAFSSGLSAAKNTVTSIFGNIVSAISGKMESAKNAVSNAIGALKSKFNFSWSLPKLKLPHVSISGGFSINPPSVPHFGISWYKNGGILNKPTIFGASGNNLLGGGEAGKEAVLPLAELWSNMKSIVAGVVQGNQNDGAASVFDRMKQLVGIQSNGQPAESVTKQLYNNVTTSNTTNRTKEDNSSTDSSKFVYSPSVVIQGNASKEDVNEALEMSQQKFNEMMDRWKKGKERTSFA